MAKKRNRNFKKLGDQELSRALAISSMIKDMLEQVEHFAHCIVKDNVDEGELDYYSIKADISPDNTLYNLRLFNSETNTCIVKSYILLDLILDCSSMAIEIKMNYDIRDMLKKINEKAHKEYTEVCL